MGFRGSSTLLANSAFEWLLHFARQFDGNEVLFREKIVFTGFIDDAHQSFRSRISIGKCFVDLPQQEGNLVPFIRDTNQCLRIGVAVHFLWSTARARTPLKALDEQRRFLPSSGAAR